MGSRTKSREHHWWPVGLQKYWTDKNGDVSWIGPEEKIGKKRAKNRKIAYKSHGHTMLRGSAWETNFECDFLSADNGISTVLRTLLGLKPLGRTPAEFFGLVTLLLRRDRHLHDMCKFYLLDEETQRKLLLLLFSLLIRSPGNRSRFEAYPEVFGMPPDEEVGKANMYQRYKIASELCETGPIANQYFVLIHSPLKKFIFGDGSLDWLTNGLVACRIDGRALVPLTPHLCVYFCASRTIRPKWNCASVSAAPWMVNWINDITQIYSRDKLFFLGKPPKLNEEFRRQQFREHSRNTDRLIDMLDEVAGTNTSARQTNETCF